MLSKAFEKYVNSLKTKKGRREHGVYLMEGEKSVLELLRSDKLYDHICVTQQWLDSNDGVFEATDKRIIVCKEHEMKKLSALQTPSPILAVVQIPIHEKFPELKGLALVLDGIQDPGNFGTIIRTAEWFGIDCVFSSDDTVDAYNPKTVQAAMGSLLRVRVIEKPLEQIFDNYSNAHVYAADMHGNDLRKISITAPALLLIGNEGSGIREQWKRYVTTSVTIPRFGEAESLNASVAASIICAWWKLNQ